MGKTLREKMAELDPDRRDRIEAETDRLHSEWALQAASSKVSFEDRQDSAEGDLD